MLISVEEGPVEWRKVLLRDTVRIATLLLATGALFAVTLALFHSFSAHRADLAQRWSARGQSALRAGRPDEAITALRTALIYAPGTRDNELMLAEALDATGRPEQADESYEYFMVLWTADPGYGPINLQLARIARKRGHTEDSINFYRAAIYGTWEGGGVQQRATARLELAQYLIQLNDLRAARMELLLAGGDTPEDYAHDMQIGSLLDQSGDPSDAESYYRRALEARPHDREARASAEKAIARAEAEQAAQAAAAQAAAAQAAAAQAAAAQPQAAANSTGQGSGGSH